MPVQIDAVSQGSYVSVTSATLPHTVGTQADRALYVFVECTNSTDQMASGTVTYGGVSLGAALKTCFGNGSNWLRVYRLVAPGSGTANIVVAPSASAVLHVWGISLYDVDQATPEGTIVSNPVGPAFASSATPIQTDATVASNGLAIDVIGRKVVASSLTPDASQTRLGTELSGGGSTSGASYKAGAGTVSMIWTHALTNNVAHLVVPVNTATAAASFSGAVTLDDTAPGGSFTTAPASSFSGSVSLEDVAPGGSFGPAPGTFTSPPLNSNNGTALVSAALSYVAAYDATTGALVARFTGLSTDSLGRFTVSSPLLTPGATLRWDWEAAAGQRRMPLGVVA